MTDSTMLGRNLREGAAVANRRSVPVDGLTSESTSSSSAVAWGAIIAGAAGAAALSLILLILGTGLGLSSVSPFSDRGASSTTFGVSTILWITLDSACRVGHGRLLGGAPAHAVDRDAHRRGLLPRHGAWLPRVGYRHAGDRGRCWAPQSVRSSARARMPPARSPVALARPPWRLRCPPRLPRRLQTSKAENGSANGYFVDSLFRKDLSTPAAASAPAQSGAASFSSDSATSTAEAGRIFASGLEAGALPPDDVKYLGQTVSQRTGLFASGTPRSASTTTSPR